MTYSVEALLWPCLFGIRNASFYLAVYLPPYVWEVLSYNFIEWIVPAVLFLSHLLQFCGILGLFSLIFPRLLSFLPMCLCVVVWPSSTILEIISSVLGLVCWDPHPPPLRLVLTLFCLLIMPSAAIPTTLINSFISRISVWLLFFSCFLITSIKFSFKLLTLCLFELLA